MKHLVIVSIGLVGFAHAEGNSQTESTKRQYDRLFSGSLEVVSEGHQFAEGMAFDQDGNFYFTDVPAAKLFKVDSKGKKTLYDAETGNTNGIAIGPDGMLYGCAGGVESIYRWDLKTGSKKAIAQGAFSNDIAITGKGRIYFTDPRTSAVCTVSPAPEYKLTKAIQLQWKPNGIGLHPDEDALMVAEFFSDTVHRYVIKADGSLGKFRPYYQMPVPREGKDNGKGYLDGMVVLPSGRLIIGTVMGIQFPDNMEADKESGIIIPPFDQRSRCNYVRLSPDGRWLYAAFQHDLVKLPLKQNEYVDMIFNQESTRAERPVRPPVQQ